MKACFGLVIGVSLLLIAPASAEEAAPACDVPAYLVTSDSLLPKTADALKDGKALSVLVVGSRSSTIEKSEDAAYPARLKAVLAEKLPGVAVEVTTEIQPKKTAEETAGGISKLLETRKPALVIWQTGTVDAMRSIDPDDFRSAVDEGVAAIQGAGADVILMNLQYSPRTETMISAVPYLDNMRAIAQQHDVPLFDRFAMMRNWSESGDFDLFSVAHGSDLAKRVHDCLARALAKLVIDTARPKPAQQN